MQSSPKENAQKDERPGYQPSIQLVSCSVALAMCFSTVLMANW